MNDAQELFDMIDSIKKQVQDNAEPDGKCRFDVQHMKWALQITEKTLQDSVKSFRAE